MNEFFTFGKVFGKVVGMVKKHKCFRTQNVFWSHNVRQNLRLKNKNKNNKNYFKQKFKKINKYIIYFTQKFHVNIFFIRTYFFMIIYFFMRIFFLLPFSVFVRN